MHRFLPINEDHSNEAAKELAILVHFYYKEFTNHFRNGSKKDRLCSHVGQKLWQLTLHVNTVWVPEIT